MQTNIRSPQETDLPVVLMEVKNFCLQIRDQSSKLNTVI